ncbi:unnamed protein product [Calicophoron daubneyi]|uniref:Uncharacterized protein n=1 Tax=Calicophoron daubneyi TaxID=300641 RepID=A0AAV2TVV4_CALDB
MFGTQSNLDNFVDGIIFYPLNTSQITVDSLATGYLNHKILCRLKDLNPGQLPSAPGEPAKLFVSYERTLTDAPAVYTTDLSANRRRVAQLKSSNPFRIPRSFSNLAGDKPISNLPEALSSRHQPAAVQPIDWLGDLIASSPKGSVINGNQDTFASRLKVDLENDEFLKLANRPEAASRNTDGTTEKGLAYSRSLKWSSSAPADEAGLTGLTRSPSALNPSPPDVQKDSHRGAVTTQTSDTAKSDANGPSFAADAPFSPRSKKIGSYPQSDSQQKVPQTIPLLRPAPRPPRRRTGVAAFTNSTVATTNNSEEPTVTYTNGYGGTNTADPMSLLSAKAEEQNEVHEFLSSGSSPTKECQTSISYRRSASFDQSLDVHAYPINKLDDCNQNNYIEIQPVVISSTSTDDEELSQLCTKLSRPLVPSSSQTLDSPPNLGSPSGLNSKERIVLFFKRNLKLTSSTPKTPLQKTASHR